MQRLPWCASVLLALVGCASADPSAPAAVRVETVDLAALPETSATSAEADAPPLARAEPSARTAEPSEVPWAPAGPQPPAPVFAGAQNMVAASTTKPLSQGELAKLEPALDAAMARDAPGMTVDGGTLGGRFAQGDVLERLLTLQPGHCYTIVAQSRGAITELEVVMVAAVTPTMPTMALAIDADQGPHATLGRAPSCFRNPIPLPLPVLVRVTATSGSGVAAVRALSK